MIKAQDAIRAARALIGTPYAELDCINLIKKVIRTAPGGVPSYTTAGTNTLWRSFEKNSKYRDITDRYDGLRDAQAGMLAFKASGEDFHHVGIITGENTVIHSSSTKGGRGVVETPLTSREGWTHLAVHRYIEVDEDGEEPREDTMESYKARVKLGDPNSTLNVRNEPGPGGDIINKLFHGQSVTVLVEYENGWMFVQYGDSGKPGYVSGDYLERVAEEETENFIRYTGTPVIIDGEGNEFFPVGGWHVEFRAND